MFNISLQSNLTKANLIMYATLIVATPFIMLQNYLQGFVGYLSELRTDVFGYSIPVVVLVFAIALITVLVVLRSKITFWNLFGLVAVFALISIGQAISDYYIDFRYYDLQNNWHYFAYFLFSFIAWSHFKKTNVAFNKIIIYTWLMGLLISLFDEFFQFHLSQRVFDLSDVAKDLWGTTTGLFILSFWVEKNGISKANFKIRQRAFKDYFRDSNSCFFLLFIASFIFLAISALLTEKKYGGYVLLITLLLWFLIWLIVHYFYGMRKKIILGLFVLLFATQSTLFLVNRNEDFIFHNNFLTIYNGLALPFFDLLVFPDKTFRFVDKKTEFNQTDKQVLMKYRPDIILIGAGKNAEGGNGFPFKDKPHFILNPKTKLPVQVLIFDSRKACVKYNELIEKGFKVVMVLHKDL